MSKPELNYYSVDDGNCLLAEKSPGDYYMLSSGGVWTQSERALRLIMGGEVDRVTRAEAEKIAGTLGGNIDKIAE